MGCRHAFLNHYVGKHARACVCTTLGGYTEGGMVIGSVIAMRGLTLKLAEGLRSEADFCRRRRTEDRGSVAHGWCTSLRDEDDASHLPSPVDRNGKHWSRVCLSSILLRYAYKITCQFGLSGCRNLQALEVCERLSLLEFLVRQGLGFFVGRSRVLVCLFTSVVRGLRSSALCVCT